MMCVCKRERERERERLTQPLANMPYYLPIAGGRIV